MTEAIAYRTAPTPLDYPEQAVPGDDRTVRGPLCDGSGAYQVWMGGEWEHTACEGCCACARDRFAPPHTMRIRRNPFAGLPTPPADDPF